MYYFAYGSNMNLEQMAYRCPGAVVISPGILRDYALIERQYADIEPKPGSMVNGVLWKISHDNLCRLDYYEGYPNFYTRYLVDIIFDSRKVGAIVYEMTPSVKLVRSGIPYSSKYRKICSDGAIMNGIGDGFKSAAEEAGDCLNLAFSDNLQNQR